VELAAQHVKPVQVQQINVMNAMLQQQFHLSNRINVLTCAQMEVSFMKQTKDATIAIILAKRATQKRQTSV
jgi:hypothetical protein